VKKEQDRQYFREIVLTPNFLEFMGAMESLQRMFTYDVSEDKTTIEDAESILEESVKSYEEHFERLISSGGAFLLPRVVWEKLASVAEDLKTLLNKWDTREELPGDGVFLIAFPAALKIGVRLYEIRTFLKKYLGIPE
jgi:hypothetical protein